MDLHDAFLKDILGNPADDTPRLVYADWLDEQGDEARAELIRAQCELAAWPCDCDTSEERVYHDECRCKERAALRGREVLLLAAHSDDWVAPLTEALGWPLVKGGRFAFRRGFPAEVDLPCEEFLRHAGALFSLAPLGRVHLTDRKPYASPREGVFGWRTVVGPGDAWPAGATATLPARLWELLPPPWAWHGVTWKDYATLPDAEDALSAACVSLGRQAAGLPRSPAAA
jgi:uncharacterized protein (TIGR02996 family)